MKVLIAKWNGFGYIDILQAFNTLEYDIVEFNFNKADDIRDGELKTSLIECIESSSPDYIFSFNYFPFIALAAKETGLKYVSWIYDSPLVLLYHYSVAFPTNFIFVFDKNLYSEFQNNGISTVYYLPLAANARRLNTYNNSSLYKASSWACKGDVSFVGSLYNDKKQFHQRLDHITNYTEGYLEGIITAQKKVYGYNFIQDILPTDIIKDMQGSLPMEVNPDGVESLEYLFAQYVINRRITGEERTEIISTIGQKYKVDLYTHNKELNLPGCINHGTINFYDEAPYVFKNSKINLNITLRSITTGVPLRAFEITGSSGFLLTNYQSDFEDVFAADEEYVYFEDRDDMMSKIDYYLTHEKKRQEIAHNSYQRCLNDHSYENRIEHIENIIF